MGIDFKIQVHNYCVKLLNEKLDVLNKSIKVAQDAANNESKSTAGDKHETGRAMAQLETEKLGAQLQNIIHQVELINRINPEEKNKKIKLGSLVETSAGIFYLSTSIGKLEINQQKVYIISTQSPIAKQLLGLSINSITKFNGNEIKVNAIY